METDGLLSDEKTWDCEGCPRWHCCVSKSNETFTKTAKEVNADWVKWEEKHRQGCEFAYKCRTPDCQQDIFTRHCKLWQERKKEVGL